MKVSLAEEREWSKTEFWKNVLIKIYSEKYANYLSSLCVLCGLLWITYKMFDAMILWGTTEDVFVRYLNSLLLSEICSYGSLGSMFLSYLNNSREKKAHNSDETRARAERERDHQKNSNKTCGGICYEISKKGRFNARRIEIVEIWVRNEHKLKP